LRPETWVAPAVGTIPNHPSFAVLLYRDVPGVSEGAGPCRRLFADNGWGGSWVDGVFDFHHFHSTSHEVLGVVAGEATLELGGPQGSSFEVSAGDVLVLPAGTGHRRASARAGFTVLGAYPAGQEDYDLLRGDDPYEVAEARERIAALGAPPSDPVGGEGVAGWH
jgi:uncharacterized protein YjlB